MTSVFVAEILAILKAIEEIGRRPTSDSVCVKDHCFGWGP